MARRGGTGRERLGLVLVAAALWGGVPGAIAVAEAQPEVSPAVKPAEPPGLAEPVLTLLGAEYLSDEERRDLRIFHGVWAPEDLDTPARRARAALIRGAADDPSLLDAEAPVEDRAEGMALRGELSEALEALEGLTSLRAVRIRAEALEALGLHAEAAAALEPLVAQLSTRQATTAEELVEGVRGLLVRTRVSAPERAGGGDFKTMLGLLASARDRLGRLYWPAYLAEAELLYAKDNRPEAAAAAMQALSLNPSCARAWSLLGRMRVDTFEFEAAEQIAARLDRLARTPGSDDEVVSALGAFIRARARLRQIDPDGAELALRPVLERMPRVREGLALEAATAAARYDTSEVDRLLAAFDAISPGSPEAYLEVGATLSEARQYEPAAAYLEEAARRAPFRPEPVIELGLMELQSGRDMAALDALRKAVALDPFNVRAANSLTLAEELVKYERVESEHFVVRYSPGPDALLAREMLGVMEENHARVAGGGPGGIDHEPAQKTTIDLMPNHRWFSVRIAGLTRIHTMAAATGPVIAMESPREGAGHSVASYDWPRVLRHEYTHTVTLSRTKNRIPHWFTEAAAVYLEDAPRDFNTCQLLYEALRTGGLFDMEGINLGFVRPRTPQDRPLAYAQGHWMYQYIVERWGERAPLELMDRYAAGERQDSAMRAVLGLEPETFLRDFKAWAAEQVRAWGMTARDGEPTAAQLLLDEKAASEAGRKDLESKLVDVAMAAAWAGAARNAVPGVAWAPRAPQPTPEAIDRWLAAYPEHPEVLHMAVTLALAGAGGEPTEAMIPLLERYAAARPVDPLPHKLLARLYLGGAGAGPGAAVPHLEFLDARETLSPTYAVALARRHAAAGDWERAAASAERATRIAPFDANHRELAATAALQRKDYATAERHIEALTVIEPDRHVHKQRLEAVRKLAASTER